MSYLPVSYYDIGSARDQIATCLGEGSLALFVGAGASKGVGLPLWWELVKTCAEAAGLPHDDISDQTPNETLRSKMEDVEAQSADSSQYLSLVHNSLYEGVQYDQSIVAHRLLIAFGALLMSSRRGSIRKVVTFNYDDVLEWYLGLHGFSTQIICKQPILERDVDVGIYHVHGFLPKDLPQTQWSDSIILSKYSYDERMSDHTNLWKHVIQHVLLSKIGLFVGLSGNDPTFGPFLLDVKRSLATEGVDARPTAFWLLTKKDEASAAELHRRNVVPLFFDSPDDFPGFLLSVCQKAAERTG